MDKFQRILITILLGFFVIWSFPFFLENGVFWVGQTAYLHFSIFNTLVIIVLYTVWKKPLRKVNEKNGMQN